MSQILSSPCSGWLNISASGASSAGTRDVSALVAVEFLSSGGQQDYFNFEHNHDTSYAALNHVHSSFGFRYTGGDSRTTTVASASMFNLPFTPLYIRLECLTNLGLVSVGVNGVLYSYNQSSTVIGSYSVSGGVLTITAQVSFYNNLCSDYRDWET